MKKLIYSIFAFAALALTSACDKQNTEPAAEPRPYVNTWVVNLDQNSTSDAAEEDWLLFTLNADGTATIGSVYTKEILEEFKNDIDAKKLTEEQKNFVDGLKVNDVYAMDGWYSIKANGDGSHVLCLVFDSLYGENKIERQSITFHIKDVTEGHMLVFNGFDDKDKLLFCDAYSLETSPLKIGTLYDQWKFNGLPSKEPEIM